MRPQGTLRLLSTLLFSLLLGSCQPAKPTIAVASNFYPTLKEILDHYPQKEHFQIASGASGTLLAQIRQGAPYGLFFSADQRYPKELQRLHPKVRLAPYAVGQLVLWSTVSPPSKDPLQVLSQSTVRTIGIAHPKTAPYGRVVVEYLQKYHPHLWKAIVPKVVWGKNVAQVAQFAELGHVQAAFLPLSLLHQRPQLQRHFWRKLPQLKLTQWYALLDTPEKWRPFLHFFHTSPKVHEILRKYGYIPLAPPKEEFFQ